MSHEGQELSNKLRYLEGLNRKNLKKKYHFSRPYSLNKFVDKNQKYELVDSQINFELIKKNQKQKEESNLMKKNIIEQEECTFAPQINNHSKIIAPTKIPIH